MATTRAVSGDRQQQGSRPLPPGSSHVFASMSTKTSVTNSSLASGNHPTPLPCAGVSSSSGGQRLMAASATGSLRMAEPPASLMLHDVGNPTIMTGIREVQTLPRNLDQVKGHQQLMLSTMRPSGQANLAGYQLVALPGHQQPYLAVAQMPSSSNPVTTTKTDGDSGQQQTRLAAQMVSPQALNIGNNPVLVYYPQQQQNQQQRLSQSVITGKPHQPGGPDEPPAPQIIQQLHHQPQQQSQAQPQQPVYYAVATSDLLRQLQLQQQQVNQSGQPQLVQTAAGLVLLRPAASPAGQSVVATTISSTTTRPKTSSPLVTTQAINSNVVVVNTTTTASTSATTTALKEPGSVGKRVGEELVCTCPPELHQAIFEQQRKQKQLHGQQHHPHPTACHEHHSIGDLGKVKVKGQVENGCGSSSSSSTLPRDHSNTIGLKPSDNIITSPLVAGTGNSLFRQLSSTPTPTVVNNSHVDDSDKSEAESHVNYLITLFQALKSSGVQPTSFQTALERVNIALPPTTTPASCSSSAGGTPSQPKVLSQPTRQALLVQQTKLDKCQQSLTALKQAHRSFTDTFSAQFNQFKQQLVTGSPSSASSLSPVSHRPALTSNSTLRSARQLRHRVDDGLDQFADAKLSLTNQLYDVECVVEQTGNDVLQRRCRITLPYVDAIDSRLDSINRAVSVACSQCPDLRRRLDEQKEAELKAIDVEKKLLEEDREQLEDIVEKCKRIKGTVCTLRRLAIVNGQNRGSSTSTSSPRRFAHLGGWTNKAAADRNSVERGRLYASIRTLQPDSSKRVQAIKKQENLAKQHKRVLQALEHANFLCDEERNLLSPIDTSLRKPVATKLSSSPTPNPTPSLAVNRPPSLLSKPTGGQFDLKPDSGLTSLTSQSPTTSTGIRQPPISLAIITTSPSTNTTRSTSLPPTPLSSTCQAPLACLAHSDDSVISTSTTTTNDSWFVDVDKTKASQQGAFNSTLVSRMIDDSSDVVSQGQPQPQQPLKQHPIGILKPRSASLTTRTASRGVMFSTTVTVDDGSEVLRLNCTLDESELGQRRVSPRSIGGGGTNNSKQSKDESPTWLFKSTTTPSPVNPSTSSNPNSPNPSGKTGNGSNVASSSAPQPPPRRSSNNPGIGNSSGQTVNNGVEKDLTHQQSATAGGRKGYENIELVANSSPILRTRMSPLPVTCEPSSSILTNLCGD